MLKESDSPNGVPQSDMFDSTRNDFIKKPVKSGLPAFYFPLVIAIIAVEAVVLVLVLLEILPIGSFEVYETTRYFTYIGEADLNSVAVLVTRWFFFLLTAGVLIPTTIIIILEMTRRVIIHFRGEVDDFNQLEWDWLDKENKVNNGITAGRLEGNYVKRFDIHQRIQHFTLMASFILLAITGFLRGFPDWPTFAWFTGVLGGSDFLRLIHDIAAFVMVADCIYHILYIFYGIAVKKTFPYAMVPNIKDLKDIIRTFLWIFGQKKEEPQYDRFQYGQKIDYWAIFWGMPVMCITGFIMMFPALFSQWFDGRWFAVCATAHRDEAVLAVGFILIVHMYYGHLATSAFPFNTVIFTGKMLKSKYKQWFGKEYAEITGEKESE